MEDWIYNYTEEFPPLEEEERAYDLAVEMAIEDYLDEKLLEKE